MKTITFKLFTLICMMFFSYQMASAEILHGSLKVTQAQLYLSNTGENSTIANCAPGTEYDDFMDYKVVTLDLGSSYSTWVWAKIGKTIDPAASGIRARYNKAQSITSNNDRQEYWLPGRIVVDGADHIAYGGSKLDRDGKAWNPTTYFSVWVTSGGTWTETAKTYYIYNQPNSPVSGDTQAPTLIQTKANNIGEREVTLSLDGGDNSGDFFYHIKDAANGLEFVSFINSYPLKALTPDTQYNLVVTPVDFSGNEGTSQTIAFRTAGGTTPEADTHPAAGVAYYLEHVASGKLLDINKDADPHNVILGNPVSTSQEFSFERVSTITDNVYYMKNVETGKYVMTYDQSTDLVDDTSDRRTQILLRIYNGEHPEAIAVEFYTVQGASCLGTDNSNPGTTVWSVKSTIAYDAKTAWKLIRKSDYATGIQTTAASTFSAYPNPAIDFVKVTSSASIKEVKVTDLLGKAVKSVKGNGASEAEINVSNLTNGVYILSVVNANNQVTVQKLIKK
ncbi:MAG: T9SS type A sorting domain-containing protein [Candidatus Symbiothrix sp.]|jgi:hypothetical protein|nr:T9SS type A sorting domain-containing protein [Candidatus Symbiothrix sp.]